MDGSALEQVSEVNTVRVRENGPLVMRAADRGYERAIGFGHAVPLRRPQHKPYCDGSHTAAGFTATGEPKAEEIAWRVPRRRHRRADPERTAACHGHRTGQRHRPHAQPRDRRPGCAAAGIRRTSRIATAATPRRAPGRLRSRRPPFFTSPLRGVEGRRLPTKVEAHRRHAGRRATVGQRPLLQRRAARHRPAARRRPTTRVARRLRRPPAASRPRRFPPPAHGPPHSPSPPDRQCRGSDHRDLRKHGAQGAAQGLVAGNDQTAPVVAGGTSSRAIAATRPVEALGCAAPRVAPGVQRRRQQHQQRQRRQQAQPAAPCACIRPLAHQQGKAQHRHAGQQRMQPATVESASRPAAPSPAGRPRSAPGNATAAAAARRAGARPPPPCRGAARWRARRPRSWPAPRAAAWQQRRQQAAQPRAHVGQPMARRRSTAPHLL